MNKKGQVTLFIIIAILIIVAALVYFIFSSDSSLKIGKISSNEVYVYVQNCLESISEGSVLEVGQGGGYFERPEFSTSNGITYYYGKNGEFHFFLKEDLEKEVSLAIKENLKKCVGNFESFEDYDEIDYRNISVESEILNNKIKIMVNYHIQLVKGEDVLILEYFEYEFSSRLGFIYGVVDKIVYEEPLKKGICLSCNFDYAFENNLNIDYLDYGETTIIFVIKDNEVEGKYGGFEFIFANDYSEENGI